MAKKSRRDVPLWLIIILILAIGVIIVGFGIYLYRLLHPETRVLVKPTVEEEYLDAANDLLTNLDQSELNSSMSNQLAYAWANYQYYQASGDESHLRTSLNALTKAGRLASKDDDPLTGYDGQAGLVCVYLADIIQDETINTDLRQQAIDLCTQAIDDYYVSFALRDIQDRAATGQQQIDDEANQPATIYDLFTEEQLADLSDEDKANIVADLDSANTVLFYYDPDYILTSLREAVASGLQAQVNGKGFTWDSDDEDTGVMIDLNQRRQIYAAINTYYYLHVLDLEHDRARYLQHRINYVYLTGQILSWYFRGLNSDENAPGFINDPDLICLLYQNLRLYRDTYAYADIQNLIDSEVYSYFYSGETYTCTLLNLYNPDPLFYPFIRDINLADAHRIVGPEADTDQVVDTIDQITLAGLLTQEEQPGIEAVIPLIEEPEIPELEIPEDFLEQYAELTQEDLDAALELMTTDIERRRASGEVPDDLEILFDGKEEL